MFVVDLADAGLVVIDPAVCQCTVALRHVHNTDAVGEAADT